MRVRAFAPADENSVVSLWLEAFPDDPPRNEPHAIVERKVARDTELFWVAEDQGVIVGAVLAGYDGVRGWLYHLAVAPSHRRRGIAKALIGEAVASLQDLGCIKVNSQVRRGNEEVQGLYEALGWVAEPVISMGRALPQPHHCGAADGTDCGCQTSS